FQGAAPLKDLPSLTVSIEQGASPSVEGNHILGLPDSPPAVRSSLGLQIQAAGGTIAHNLIQGGKGRSNLATTTASRGVFIDGLGGPITLADNIIDGGDGQQQLAAGGVGSVGVDVRDRAGQASSLVLRRNEIRGGRGRAAQGVHGAGINVENSSGIDLLDNDVRGNSDGGLGIVTTPSTITGIRLLGASNVKVTGNRVYAGEAVATTTGLVNLTGVSLNRCQGVALHSNVVHGGNGFGTTFHAVPRGITLTTVTDISVNDPPNSDISLVSNTILSGRRGGPAMLSAALQISGPQTGLGVVNNLLVSEARTGGAAGSQSLVLNFPDCYQDSIAVLEGNALVSAGVGPLAAALGGQNASPAQVCKQLSPGTTAGNSTVSLLKANNKGSPLVEIKDTVVLTSTCVGEDQCTLVPECSTTEKCLTTLFTAHGFGSGPLPVLAHGFRLRDQAPCPLQSLGVASVPLDLF
ncbi:MAG: right-handed parallel beta-helix repeat-containing protein, partial [Myxococcales bacterium]